MLMCGFGCHYFVLIGFQGEVRRSCLHTKLVTSGVLRQGVLANAHFVICNFYTSQWQPYNFSLKRHSYLLPFFLFDHLTVFDTCP